ncbi:MAG: LOG family protein [Candidatus Shapirobacteria bacterium]|nr:LOG family protein [Candidatus Shapirobacteria bacterium]MDD4410096.1 LOG family protein [Candidatus Shapirobacteria bacterium]
MLAITKKKIKRVAFFGDADAKPTDQHYIDAFNTAKLLAENGYIIVNGGGPGVMLAATMGAKEGKGKVELVIIDEKVDMGPNYEGSGKENKSKADKIYRVKTIQSRTEKLTEIADAYVIFKGGTGTMAELALVWEKAKFEYGKHEPLLFFGDCWRDTIETMVRDLNFDKTERKVYDFADNSEEVLKIIQNKKSLKKTDNGGLFGRFKKMIDNF